MRSICFAAIPMRWLEPKRSQPGQGGRAQKFEHERDREWRAAEVGADMLPLPKPPSKMGCVAELPQRYPLATPPPAEGSKLTLNL
jgi:hypothetical protein